MDFLRAIKKIYGTPAEGDFVDVFDNKDNFWQSSLSTWFIAVRNTFVPAR